MEKGNNEQNSYTKIFDAKMYLADSSQIVSSRLRG